MADTEAPAAVLVVEKSDEQWVWHSLEEDVVGNIEGTRLESGTALEETATFSIADYTVRFHPAADRVTFVVFDPDRPA